MKTKKLSSIKQWAKALRTEVTALYYALRDPRTPWYAKVAGWLVVGYALSPIDLIPDFVPILGYIDDLIIVPAGIWIVRKMVPAQVLVDARTKAVASTMPVGTWAAAIVVAIWIAAIAGTGWWIWKYVIK